MKNNIIILYVTLIIIIAMVICYLITRQSLFQAIQNLSLSVMMASLAYNHIKSNKERQIKKFNISVCLLLFSAITFFVMAVLLFYIFIVSTIL